MTHRRNAPRAREMYDTVHAAQHSTPAPAAETKSEDVVEGRPTIRLDTFAATSARPGSTIPLNDAARLPAATVRLDENTGNSVQGQTLIGSYLLDAGVITTNALNEALALARRTNIRVGQALLQLRHINEHDLALGLAQQQGIPFRKIDAGGLDHSVAKLFREADARRWQALPVAVGAHTITVAMVDSLDQTARMEIEQACGKTVIPQITMRGAWEHAMDGLYRHEYSYRSTQDFRVRSPHQSAFQVVNRSQAVIFSLLRIGTVIWLLINPLSWFIALNTLATLFYVAFSWHRFLLVYRALVRKLEVPVEPDEIAALNDRDLPYYTILVPVYREAGVLPKLTRAIAALDYPQAKLDVKLLMEADDLETIQAARALNLPPNFEHVIVPDSLPKTKPKACNYGLIKARGTYVVIYDAEDVPEADQLKKVVAAFGKLDEQVVCIQAKLNYFNRNQNLLTRWFTIEYSMWFDLFLPGLVASNAPVPLGGTSNHFRRDRLEALGAWDPFNVTEDADLGVRLYKAGYKTAIIDSTTLEEANSKLGNWIRQRSRWVKGYIQTWLVHMRHPAALWRAIGPKAFLGFNLTVGGTVLTFLLNPLYWGLTALWFLTEWGVIEQMFPPIIYYLGGINLFFGNFTFIYLNMAGALRREFDDLVKYALFSPIYWLLISIGAWKGLVQLFTKPFYWEKTVHGLDQQPPINQHPSTIEHTATAEQAG